MQYSIVKLSDVKTLTDSLRLDAEFFQDLSMINFMSKFNLYSTNELCFITDGEHGSPDWDEKTNIKYIVAENIKPNYILENNFKTISVVQHKKNTRSIIQEDDVLIYSVGGRGYVAKAEKHLFPCNIPRSVAILRLLNKDVVLPEYLSLFLNSKYGSFQIQRLQAGNVQPMLSIENIKKINIISVSMTMQLLLSSLYNTSYILRQKAKEQYKKAEDILLEELGFKNYKLQHQLSYIKTFSEVKNEERLDAEYYQPKYEEILNKIYRYKLGSGKISEYFQVHEKSFKKEHNHKYKYVEIGSIDIINKTIEYQNLCSEELPDNAKYIVNKDTIIISKVRPNRGAIAIIKDDKIVCSGAFTVLLEKDILNKETLLVFLNMKVILNFILKYNIGTSYPTVTDKDILNMPIPLIDQNKQKLIKKHIDYGDNSQVKSKKLLEIATKAVEMAIEQNEDLATEWIHSQIQAIDVQI